MKTAFLFPGQGSQQPGMLSTLPINEPEVSSLYLAATSFLKQDLSTIDTKKNLLSTVNVQLSLLIAGVITAKRLISSGIKPDYVAGHSVGTFAAAVISEAITFEQAIALVYTRAQLMENAFPKGYGMAALIGFTQSRLKPFLEKHNLKNSTVYLSNINEVDQLVVSGALQSISVLIKTLQKAGIQKTKILDVKVPSHCELMYNVAKRIEVKLKDMELKMPVIPLAANSTGRLLKTADEVRKDLWMSLATPVKWYDATTLIYEKGTRIFIEMEPSGVLSKIAKSTFPEAVVLNTNEANINQLAEIWNNYRKDKIN